MVLAKCPEWGHYPVSRRAKACPNCGCPLDSKELEVADGFSEARDAVIRALGSEDDYADVLVDFETYFHKSNGGPDLAWPYMEQTAPQHIQRWRKAADLGVPEAEILLGVCSQEGLCVAKDYSEAMRCYRKAADAGSACAMWCIGELYRCDDRGVAKDYSEAMRWYRKAADGGDIAAQVCIGLLYNQGNGVVQDYGEAMRWFRKAADRGNVLAMAFISTLYEKGNGVAQDHAEAERWLSKGVARRAACKQGIDEPTKNPEQYSAPSFWQRLFGG